MQITSSHLLKSLDIVQLPKQEAQGENKIIY